jgi:WD40 repeat protein
VLALMQHCWAENPAARPAATAVVAELDRIAAALTAAPFAPAATPSGYVLLDSASAPAALAPAGPQSPVATPSAVTVLSAPAADIYSVRAKLSQSSSVRVPMTAALPGQDGALRSIAVLSSGGVVTGGAYRSLTCYSTVPGPERWAADPDAHDSSIECISAAPDGTMLASLGSRTSIRLWRTNSGALIDTLVSSSLAACVLGASGRVQWLAGGGAELVLWPLGPHGALTDEPQPVPLGDDSPRVAHLAASDGRLFIGLQTGTVLVAAVTPRLAVRVETELRGYNNRLEGIACTADGRRVAVSGPGGVWVWDLARGMRSCVCVGAGDCSYGVAFSPDGSLVVASDGSATASVFGTGSGTLVATIGTVRLARAAAFASTPLLDRGVPPGTCTVLVGVSDGVLRRYDLPPQLCTWSPESHASFPRASRRAVRALVLAASRPACLLQRLPPDVLLSVAAKVAVDIR